MAWFTFFLVHMQGSQAIPSCCILAEILGRRLITVPLHAVETFLISKQRVVVGWDVIQQCIDDRCDGTFFPNR